MALAKQNTEVIEAEALPAVRNATPLAAVNAESLLSQAITAGVNIETLERLVALRATLRAEQAQQAFLEAMAGFQGECPVIPKDATAKGGKFSYNYAPLDTIITTIQPHLRRWGLIHTIDTRQVDENGVTYQEATCTISHVQGHSQTSTFRAPIDQGASMNDMQKAASAQTYAKRYALVNAYGIVTGDEDDDAGGKHVGSAPEAPPAKLPEVRGVPEEVDLREGGEGAKKWKKWGAKLKGQFYGTFSATDGAKLEKARDEKIAVWITYSIDDKGRRTIEGVSFE
jgi:hypothetical protein